MSEFPESGAKARAKSQSTWPSLVVAIIVAVIWSLLTSIRLLDDPDVYSDGAVGAVASSLGAALGSGLFIAGIVWLVLFLGFTRRLAPARAGSQFGILFAATLLAAVPVCVLTSTIAAKQQGAAEFQELMTRTDSRHERLLADIAAERDRIVAGGFMEPEALAQPGGLDRAQEKLVKLRALSVRAVKDAEHLSAVTRASVERLPIPADRRTRVMADYDAGFAEGRADGAKDLKLANAALDAMESQLAILARTPRAWTVEGGQLVFAHDADVAAFNEHAQTLTTTTERTEARQRERAARRQAIP